MDPTLDDLSSLATGGDYAMDYGLDTATTGAGADPYGTNLVPGGSAEEWSTGMRPGGPDGQLSPWSPGGGFDFTNLLRGIPGWMSGFGSRGPMANPGALAVGGDPSVPYGGPDAYGGVPDVYTGGSPTFNEMGRGRGMSARANVGSILRGIRQSTGLRVTARSITNLIVRYGFKATAALTGADNVSLLSIFMQQKGTTHHRRGPGIYTPARNFRRCESLKRTCARVLGRGGHHRRRARHPFYRRRRRK